MSTSSFPDLSDRRIIVPGGTGAVGEGVVRQYLAAGANVVVPTRSEERSAQFRQLLDDAATSRLHLVVHDYTSFAGAEDLLDQTINFLGGVDDVIAPIGGWWAGGPLATITESDWQSAFVGLASTHMAVLRSTLPRLSADGTYQVIVGDSSHYPVPNSGLVSMEQAAVLMMQRVAAAEFGAERRIFSLILGPVRTRDVAGGPDWIGNDEVGTAAVALSASTLPSASVSLHNTAELNALLSLTNTASTHH